MKVRKCAGSFDAESGQRFVVRRRKMMDYRKKSSGYGDFPLPGTAKEEMFEKDLNQIFAM